METRRQNIKLEFQKSGFERVDTKQKADKYELIGHAAITIYFYWKQGNELINLAIDPRVSYKNLLNISGVSLQETKHGDGLRFGTTMKGFPQSYDGHTPEDSKSLVGRLFRIQENKLYDFLALLVLNANSGLIVNSANELSSGKSVPPKSKKSEVGLDLQVSELSKAIHAIEDEFKNKPGADIDSIVKRRIGQSAFRSLLERYFGTKCNVTGLSKKSLLIASHIIPWSKSKPEEKTDHENGLLLSISWDAVFDKGFVTFNDQGGVVFSDELDMDTSDSLGLDRNARLNNDALTPNRIKYLKRHHDYIFEYWKKA